MWENESFKFTAQAAKYIIVIFMKFSLFMHRCTLYNLYERFEFAAQRSNTFL